jgi:hypothetical protein
MKRVNTDDDISDKVLQKKLKPSSEERENNVKKMLGNSSRFTSNMGTSSNSFAPNPNDNQSSDTGKVENKQNTRLTFL